MIGSKTGTKPETGTRTKPETNSELKKIFTCGDSYEDAATCIYTAWEYALKVGHSNVRIEREPVSQLDMFSEYEHVEADSEKTARFTRSVQKISAVVYRNVFYALLSDQNEAVDAVYRYLILAFREGRKVEHMLIDPEVMRVMELSRRVSNEAHKFREMARFTSVDRKVYVCNIEPKSDVSLLVAEHFSDRMPSEHWVIVDDMRHTAVVHPADGDMYLKRLTGEEFNVLSSADNMTDEYTDMWRTFFDAIAIEQRENYRCQRTLFPLWIRKHATEFMR